MYSGFLQFVKRAEFHFFLNFEFVEKFGLIFGKKIEFPKKNLSFEEKSSNFLENPVIFLVNGLIL